MVLLVICASWVIELKLMRCTTVVFLLLVHKFYGDWCVTARVVPLQGPEEYVVKAPAEELQQSDMRKTNLDCISLEQKSCRVYFSVLHHTRGESGKDTSWSQTLKNWRRWTHQSSTPEGSTQRKY